MDNSHLMANLKIVNVGDSGVGKTCVLISFVENEFPSEHVPTAFDNYTSMIDFGDRPWSTGLWDTSGQDNDTMRPLSYNDAKVVLIYFSLVDRKSFDKVEKFWVPEVLKNAKDCPFIVVGNKVDLRNDKNAVEKLGVKPVTSDEGKALTKKLGGLAYRECSAKTQEGLGEVFQAAVASCVAPETLENYVKPSVVDPKKEEQKKGFLSGLFGKK